MKWRKMNYGACAVLAFAASHIGGIACGHDRLVAIEILDAGEGGIANQGTGGFSNQGTGGSPNQGTGGGTSGCTLDNSPCGANQECCSGECVGHVCQSSPIPTCRQKGVKCIVPSDCCSKACPQDVPVDQRQCPVVSSCSLAGEPCLLNSDCCSGACADPGTGTPSCQSVDGCKPVGEICTTAADCCSVTCGIDSTSQVTHCVSGFPGCLPAGEICDPTQPRCCSDFHGGGGGAGGGPGSGFGGGPGAGLGGAPPFGLDGGPPMGLCQLTDIGVYRCMTRPQCAQNGPCRLHEECCSRYCLPTPSGTLACQACADLDRPCIAARDCCDPNASCVSGICKLTGAPCKQLGASCSSSGEGECCAKNCQPGLTAAMTCVVSAAQ